MRHIPIDIDLAQVAFQAVDAVVRQLDAGAVLPDGQHLAAAGDLLVEERLQAAGQHPFQVPFEDVPERLDGVALRGKFQIGRNVDQADLRAALPQLTPQRDAVHGVQIHIQQRHLIQLQIRHGQCFFAAGADHDLRRDLPLAETGPDQLLHPCGKPRVVITDQYVHGRCPLLLKKAGSPMRRVRPFECTLRDEFVVEAEGKDEQNDQRQTIGQITAHPVLHLGAFAGVDFLFVVLPAPAAAGNAEQQIDQ